MDTIITRYLLACLVQLIDEYAPLIVAVNEVASILRYYQSIQQLYGYRVPNFIPSSHIYPPVSQPLLYIPLLLLPPYGLSHQTRVPNERVHRCPFPLLHRQLSTPREELQRLGGSKVRSLRIVFKGVLFAQCQSVVIPKA